MTRVACSAITLAVLTATASLASDPVQSQESFRAAVRNHSTAPPYVFITVVNKATGERRSSCTTVNLLMGAIHREYGLAYDLAGEAGAERIALRTEDHVFRFLNKDALKNVEVNYDERTLETVRKMLQPYSVDQLRKGFSGSGDLHSLYQGKHGSARSAYRDAAACVLIERGLSPGMGDRSDQLWIAK